jgi:hypothetical protein
MKKVLAAFVIAVAAIVFFLAGCAGTPKAIPDEEAWSRFVGEWMCPDTATVGNLYPALQVYEADLLGKWYYFSGATAPNLVLRFKPRKSWVDSEGYVYCQVHFQKTEIGAYSSAFECAGLMRIDKTGKVLEINAISGVSEQGSMADWAYKQLEQTDPELAKKLPASSSGGSQMGGWLGIYWIYYRT